MNICDGASQKQYSNFPAKMELKKRIVKTLIEKECFFFSCVTGASCILNSCVCNAGTAELVSPPGQFLCLDCFLNQR